MKIYLIRHGQTDFNLKKIYNVKEEDLNETGIMQAQKLKELVNEIDYDIIISSPLLRAKHTAKIVNIKNKKIIYDERLVERDAGNLQGQKVEVTDRDEYWNYYTTKKIRH